MDRQIRRLGYAFIALFVLLFGAVNYIQVYAASDLANHPSNQRLLLQEYNVHRGQILARDARTILATSRATEGKLKYLRAYPRPRLYAGITGYYSVVFGRYGLERSQNEWLAGRASELLPQNLVDEMLGRDKRGATVVTTIDPRLQRVAARQLGSLPGGVVALNPKTGEILALVANPSYDPNSLSSHELKEVRAARARLLKDPDKPLLSRAAQELFPPGSTFKLVTAAAALENGMKPDTRFPNPPVLDLPQTTHQLHNFGGGGCPGGAQLSIAQALQISCNVVFGEIGLKLGADKLVAQTQKFGFGQDVPLEIPFAEGRIPPVRDFQNALPAVAFSAIGQQSVGANPLQMALVGAAIANGGVQMTPRLVKEVRDPSGRVIKTFRPDPWGRPISASTAAALTRMMISVVEAGTGTAAQIPGVTVAGKTGTAETQSGDPHAWFVSFAPAQEPEIVVAVVVLNGGDLGSEATGGRVAAPIARALIRAAVGR
jgi:peptidoglycan glycosyltransferase